MKVNAIASSMHTLGMLFLTIWLVDLSFRCMKCCIILF